MVSISDSRNETVNWHLGDNAALTFNTPDGNPVPISNSGLSTLEGCSSISDTNGNLLFYTDGVRVWNRNNKIINREQELTGHYSSTQSVLIVRKPKSYNIFYIFTTDAGKYIENIDPSLYENRGLRYSVLDMHLNDGLGDIIEYNVLLHVPITEKLTSVFHQNDEDIWILSHEWGNKNVLAYLLTENGITKSIISESLTGHMGDADKYIGHIKSSPKGDKIAYVVQGFNFIELQEFDNESGVLSNSIQISTDNRVNNYGLEFSPSGKLIYVTDYSTNTIYQYDVSIHDADSIKASQHLVASVPNVHSIGALQLAPNGKIYVAQNEQRHLGVIPYPEKHGDSCIYIREGVFLGSDFGVRSRLGLPNLNQSLYQFKVKIDYSETCQHNPLRLRALLQSDFDSAEFEWFGPNGFYSTNKNISLTEANFQMNGIYKVIAKYRDYISSDSVEIVIKDAPQVRIKGDTLICQNTFSKLEASIKSDTLEYYWSNGSKGWQTTISYPGIYYLETFYPNGCSSKDTIVVKGLITNSGFTDVSAGHFFEIPIDKPHIINLEFFNFGMEDLAVNSIFIAANSYQLKIIDNIKQNNIIKSGDKREFKIEIFSKKPVKIIDTFVVEVVSPYCIMEYYAEIKGDIIVPVKSQILSLKASPAEIIEIPVRTIISTQTDTSFRMPFKVDLSFPANYFYPESVTNGEIIENFIIDNIRYISIKGVSVNLSSHENNIFRLKGKVLVGDTEPGEFVINKIDWGNELFKNTFDSGDLILESCTLAIRPIQVFKPTKMSVYPNPVVDSEVNISVYSTERGLFRLVLLNSSGNMKEIVTWQRDDSDSDEFNYKINLDKFSTGAYQLILYSPWYIRTEKINIIR
ncbi:MAG: hypothetical protein KIT33_12175 [Candidatus Kapabacteria bacterium]|nr:hypothetical protein [Ignavibacteriota bacterium]MCW5885717.1 hypothetical protein [Candidatus Kapabacteria bacterium]